MYTVVLFSKGEGWGTYVNEHVACCPLQWENEKEKQSCSHGKVCGLTYVQWILVEKLKTLHIK